MYFILKEIYMNDLNNPIVYFILEEIYMNDLNTVIDIVIATSMKTLFVKLLPGFCFFYQSYIWL